MMTRQEAPFRVITCADAGYFPFLPFLERNIARKFGRLPVIYDLGLTDDQRPQLASELRQAADVPADFRGTEQRHGFIRATHKPACIRDSLDRDPGGCLCVDADVLFLGRLDLRDFQSADVAVTPRHPKERTPAHLDNGRINTGVLFFSGSPRSRRLLADWQHACETGTDSDQKCLSDLLGDFDLSGPLGLANSDALSLAKLDPCIYNDVRQRTGRILHFKNAGRDPGAARKLATYRRLEENHPILLAALHRFRRLVRGME